MTIKNISRVAMGVYLCLVTFSTELKAEEILSERLLDGSTLSVDYSVVDESSALLGITVRSSTGVVSSAKVRMQPGDYADYFLEATARHESIELFGQCSDIKASSALGRVGWLWPTNGTPQVLYIPSEGTPAVLGVCPGAASLCRQTPTSEINEDLSYLNPSFDGEFSQGSCPFQNDSIQAVPVVSGDSSDSFEFPLPVQLSDAECSAALASACWVPYIVNNVWVTTADSPGEVMRGGAAASLQRARRSLSRALRSRHQNRVASAIGQVVSILTNALRSPQIRSESSKVSMQRARSLLRKSSVRTPGRLRRVISLLRGLSSAK
jgi:hypothetical protein